MIEETYYMSQIDNRLYYIKDARIVIKPDSYIVMHIFPDTRTEEVRKLVKLNDMNSFKKLNMDERLYFVSEFDSMVHNLNDWEHKKIGSSKAYIGRDWYDDGFRTEEEVNLRTLKEVMEFLRYINRKKDKE